MGQLERVYSFHQEVAAGRYPNATMLVEEFEVSLATARRDITYLRDRLLAPLAFDSRKNGFYYTEDGFSLPFAQSPKITLLLGILNKFAEETGLSGLEEVRQLEEKLSSMLSADHATLLESLYFEWIEIESINTEIFSVIIEAVVARRAVEISYATAGVTGTNRCVEPQRLCNYQGRWYLLAYCRLRRELRMFHIARIGSARPTGEKISPAPEVGRNYLQSSFGIFKGGSTEIATIFFTGTVAGLVKHQHWHQNQRVEETDNGILLHIPISDDREIAMKVLQYGAQAQVIQPERLRQRVAGEIEVMRTLYTC